MVLDVWADGETRSREWRRKTSSCFHLMEANPSVCSPLNQIKWAGCGFGVFFLFLLSPPSFNCDGFISGREERGELLIGK